ncbi:hypothetical protein [Tenacibaculum jejuense]|uniref:Uncharacterized protein n=1 Tax=Tenacibaculum jejuense TaxID=584609 RepID=A0A238UDE5_9FLAO|nr:hypothetical protein [Tenacibaculum jejuense]SNR17223.1 Protein of unknown function precursor [Tenacibaculum jejuense]
MKKITCFLIFLSSLIVFAQEKVENFPHSFLGKYKGTLEITSKRGTQKIPMEFHLTKTEKDSVFNYVIVYDKSPRNYFLKIVDQEKGIYDIDENNGIILPASFHKNVLHSFFEVQGNFLSTRLAFDTKQLEFEILFTRLENKTTTGGISKEIPEVFGYPIGVFQKAILVKD